MPSHARFVLALVAALVLSAALAACDAAGVGPHGASGAPSRGASPAVSGPRSPSGSPEATDSRGREFGFAVIGDFGSKDDAEDAVADEIREWAGHRPLDGLVTTGDNVYESGGPEDFQEAWSGPYGWVDEGGIPLVAALGNHDIETDGGQAEMALLHMPNRWYARRIGPVELVVLDSNDVGNEEQLAWLRDQLSAERAPWTVVVFHHPAFSCGFHPSTPTVDELWMPVFAQAGVDLVLNGHDHNYQRFPSTDGVTYVVDGAGGKDLYPASPAFCPRGTPTPESIDDQDHLFLYLEVTRSRLAGRAVTASGEVVDSFELDGR